MLLQHDAHALHVSGFTWQAEQERSTYTAPLLMHGSILTYNDVQHSLLMVVGNRTSWRDLTSSNGNKIKLSFSVPCVWISGMIIEGNTLVQPVVVASAALTPCAREDGLKLLTMLLSPPSQLQSELQAMAGNGTNCTGRALQELGAYQQNTPPMNRPRLPAVLWATFSTIYLGNSNISNSTGFHHALRMDNTRFTLQNSTLVGNVAVNHSLIDIWYSTTFVEDLVLSRNVGAGMLDLDSSDGFYQRVSMGCSCWCNAGCIHLCW